MSQFFEKGNELWRLAKEPGRKVKIKSPEHLWEKAVEYFTWATENPLWEEKVFCHQGEVTRAKTPKLRAMTLRAMWVHMGISKDIWARLKSKEEFQEVVKDIDDVIFTNKFEGAAAGFLKENLIARELGLADKQDRKIEGELKTELTMTERAARIASLLDQAKKEK